MAAAIITDKDVRTFLMDKPELNPLLGGVRWTAEDIDHAAINAIDYFNSSAPFTGNSYTVETFPFRYLLLTGITGHLLRGAAINEASNQFTYAVDGVQVQDKDKAELFMRLGNQFWAEFQEQCRLLKINQAAAQIYGTVGSEFGRRSI
jgi:hypothetical protein